MRIIILGSLCLSLAVLTGCASRPTPNSNYQTINIYTEDDSMYSKRVDYLGYGLGGEGFGGYSMGGYGLTGYGGQFPGE